MANETRIVGSKYRLLQQLGQGGMGSVWHAEHLTLRSAVAIKLIDPEIAQNPDALARFLREAQSAAALRSPHVVQILDYGVDEGIPYIAMELLEGESLATRLERVGRLNAEETARILTHVARAVGRAHEAGIVHRDLKPDNVFLIKNDEEEVAKVLDFGIAKSTSHALSASAASGTRTGAILGTPYYMSPEQAEGVKTLDHRTDIWAMGVIAFECLVGRRPFEAETLGSMLLAICTRPLPVPSSLGPFPPEFDAWFARACARDVRERFSTAKEAASELRKLCRGSDAHGMPASVAFEPVRSLNSTGRAVPGRSIGNLGTTTGQLGVSGIAATRRRSTGVVAVAAGVLAAAALAGAFLFLRQGASGSAETPPANSESARPQPAAQATPVPPPQPPLVTPGAAAEARATSSAPAASAPSEATSQPAKPQASTKIQPKKPRTAPVSQAVTPSQTAPPAQPALTSTTRVAPSPAPAEKPATAPAKVNLGI